MKKTLLGRAISDTVNPPLVLRPFDHQDELPDRRVFNDRQLTFAGDELRHRLQQPVVNVPFFTTAPPPSPFFHLSSNPSMPTPLSSKLQGTGAAFWLGFVSAMRKRLGLPPTTEV